MTAEIEQLWSKVLELSAVRRASIGFGLLEWNKSIAAGLAQCKTFADLTIVTPSSHPMSGFKVIRSQAPEDCLASLLVTGQIEGIVRGTVDDKRTLNAYLKLTKERDTYCPTLLEDALGRQYFIAPVSNSDGWTGEQRLSETLAIARFFRSWGISPKIAVYSAIREETRKANLDNPDPVYKYLCTTHDDAVMIVQKLAAEGFPADNKEIEFNVAVEQGYNLHVCVNGIVGNQMARAIMSSGGRILTCTRIGLSHVYEDNSRTETDFRSHIEWACALVNARKQN